MELLLEKKDEPTEVHGLTCGTLRDLSTLDVTLFVLSFSLKFNKLKTNILFSQLIFTLLIFSA